MLAKNLLTTSGVAAGALALAIASSPASAADALKIGSPESISGDWAPYTAAHGMRCAVEVMNEQGGVNGAPIELTVQDNKSDPAIALALAQEMLDAGVTAVGATPASDSLIPVSQLAAEYDTMTYSGVNTQIEMFEIGLDNFITMAVPDPFNASATAEVAYELGARRVVLFLSDVYGTWTRNLPEWFGDVFERFGGEVVGRMEYPGFGMTDWSPFITNIKAMDPMPDSVHISSINPDVGVLIRQLRAAGLDIFVFGSDGFDDPTLAEVAGGATNVDGTVFFATHGLAWQGNALDQFQSECIGRGYEINGAFFGLGGDVVRILARGVELAGTTESRSVLDALFSAGPIEAITAPTIDFTNKWHYPSKEVSVVGFANGEPMLQSALVPKHSPHYED
jgi:branched-chain amino acid transport system substrate-binding protein